jgi:hypothetical protein
LHAHEKDQMQAMDEGARDKLRRSDMSIAERGRNPSKLRRSGMKVGGGGRAMRAGVANEDAAPTELGNVSSGGVLL